MPKVQHEDSTAVAAGLVVYVAIVAIKIIETEKYMKNRKLISRKI